MPRGAVPASALVGLIESIHGAGVDGDLWPQALAATTRLIGGIGCTLEVFDRGSLQYDSFYAYNVPKREELDYVEHYAALNPRRSFALKRRAGDLVWDYQFVDEGTIDRLPFYAEFLNRQDMRYSLSALLATGDNTLAAVAVQRSHGQGHIGRREIELMGHLVRHLSQALDVTRRLRAAVALQRSLASALDWLADGVVLIDRDGAVLYSNAAAAAIAAAGDGMVLKRNRLEFAAPAARQRYAAACAAMLRFHDGGLDGSVEGGGADFAVSRPSGAPAYLVSVRPLPAVRWREVGVASAAAALVLVRDPLHGGRIVARIFRDVLGLSEAEASLAQALQVGTPPIEYARMHHLSANTVYTHLKRIKEKTGCHRMSALIRRLNDLQMLPLTELIYQAVPKA